MWGPGTPMDTSAVAPTSEGAEAALSKPGTSDNGVNKDGESLVSLLLPQSKLLF